MKTLFSLILIIFLFVSCNNSTEIFPVKSDILGHASTINLDVEETNVNLQDYFFDVLIIDSVKLDKYQVTLSDDKKIITVKPIENPVPQLSILKVYIQQYEYDILVKASQKIKHTFSFNAEGKKYETVQVAGDMNAWNAANTNLQINDEGIWEASMYLDPGKYQYLLVLNGEKVLDPGNPDKEDNNVGGVNSVIRVGQINKELLPKLFTYKHTKGNNLLFGCENEIDDLFVFWQNHVLSSEYVEKTDGSLTVKIPEIAKKTDRSFIHIYAANKYGFSNDILVPINKGYVVDDVALLNRTDKHTQIIYNIMVDRFFNGNITNDKPLNDPKVHKRADYHGGDIAGIEKVINMNYFNELGINTLWISPIIQNPEGAYGKYPNPETSFSGYHGYWPISFTQIDHRFGTPVEFKNLINTTHNNNMNLLLDFVANHVHENHPVYKAHTDWATNLYLPDGTLNTEKWDEHRLTTWFDVFLPTLDLSKPEVYNMLTDSAVYWVNKYNIDGFRHDATKHVPEVFWRTLTQKLKNQVAQNKSIYQIGETYGSRELISSYVNSGELDGQFDFNTYDAAVASFAKDETSFLSLKESLEASFKYYGNHNLMGYISGNQDRARFISYASGALKFDEDAKLAGWTREIKVEDPVGYKKLASLLAFNMVIPGVPVIFYGDEIGMVGGNDPDNRRMMRFENLSEDEASVLKTTQKMVHIRKNNLPFLYGDTEFLLAEKDVLVIARTYFDEIGIAVFNKSSEKKEINFTIPGRFNGIILTSNFGNENNINGEVISIILKPNSFEILTKK